MEKESIKPSIEINKAYYPLIARICAISVGFDVLFFIIYFISQSYATWTTALIVIVYIIKIAIFVWLAFLSAYRWTFTYYYIEADAGLLIKNEGLHFPKKTSYNLNNLHSISIDEGPIQKLLKYGNLFLTFTVEGSQEILTILEVVNPAEYKQYFDKYLK